MIQSSYVTATPATPEQRAVSGVVPGPITPSSLGAWAPSGRPHAEHRPMRPISFTQTGPLKALVSCPDCGKTSVVVPNQRLRKPPEGFTVESWGRFMEYARQRNAGLVS